MAQLYFKYGAMGSSKSANALMARFNYELVRQHQKVVAAGEKLPPEVGLQAVADHRDLAVVHQVHQVVDLLLGEELGLVHDDAGKLHQLPIGHLAHLVKIDTAALRGGPQRGAGLLPDARGPAGAGVL